VFDARPAHGYHRATMFVRLLAALSFLSGCSASLTEVVIVVDTDLAVPLELDRVEVEVTGPDGTVRRSAGDLRVPNDLPATVGVVHRGGSLEGFTATVEGLREQNLVVRRTAQFALVDGEVRLLRLDVLRRCASTPDCGPGMTCGENGCRSIQVSIEELAPYNDVIPRFDGAVPWIDAGPEPDAGAIDAGEDAGPPADAGPTCSFGTCGTGASACSCEACNCELECAAQCEVDCRANATCTTQAPAEGDVDVECVGSTCLVLAEETASAVVACTEGASCEVACRRASSCRVDCAGGSACLLRCQAAGDCGFDSCDGEELRCPMQVQACNRACP
jgi:hypothetical protein